MDRLWLPVEKHWRLNERHYGALQGLNKAETAAKFGEQQVLVWRRSYDMPPPEMDPGDAAQPRARPPLRGPRGPREIPLGECLKDTVERVLPYWNERIVAARGARASACSSPRTATACARWSSTSTAWPTRRSSS